MAQLDEKKPGEALEVAASGGEDLDVRAKDEPALTAGEVAEGIGTDKWVFASFFVGAIGAAFLVGKILASLWNYLAEEAWVVRQAAFLLRYPEDERPMFTTVIGGLVGVAVMVYCLRTENVRRWADDVALELTKVTWRMANSAVATRGWGEEKSLEGFPSGQWEQAVNLPAFAFVGSNPTPSTSFDQEHVGRGHGPRSTAGRMPNPECQTSSEKNADQSV